MSNTLTTHSGCVKGETNKAKQGLRENGRCDGNASSVEADKLDNNTNSIADEQLNWLRLIRDRRWSASQKYQLLDQLGSPDEIYALPLKDRLTLIGDRLSNKNNKPSSELDAELRRDMTWLRQPNHALITLNDATYPKLLRQIADPPIALFAIGNPKHLLEPKVSIVGSRRPTPIGVKVARQIASELTEFGVVVTSGMALGIDGLAHEAALQLGEPTIAVMGCGLDKIYPNRNRALFEQISEQGLLLSEYPLGVPPSKHTFPRRNRIVSGLSYGVVIIEAADRSGTLITARLAAEQDREVMVVPGSSVSAQYHGSHRLLQQGAALVLNGLDVVQVLSNDLSDELGSPDTLENGSGSQNAVRTDKQLSFSDAKISEEASPEDLLLDFISVESTMVDHVISASGLTAAEVSSMLLILELRGLIAIADDGGYLNLS